MISLKIGRIMVAAFIAGAFVASPIPQAIAAVIATDVQCTGCVGTSDLAGNAVTSGKINDGAIRTADLADGIVINRKLADNSVSSTKILDSSINAIDLHSDSVTADELAGVSKLIFESTCTNSNEISMDPFEVTRAFICPILGASSGDSVILTKQEQGAFLLDCMDFRAATAFDGEVVITLANTCTETATASPGNLEAAVIVFHE